MSHTIAKLIRGAALLVFALTSIAVARPAEAATSAAPGELCFKETGICIRGRIREYWEQNGGLAVFGYPIRGVNGEGGSQMFERAELEQHHGTPAPYDIQLARLSDLRYAQQGVSWEALPRDAGPKAGCLWFQETQRNVCDQQAGAGFLTYWQTHGLKDPKLNAYGRSLALFGLPITSARPETNAAGEQVITQWFERARFEWHPNKPKEYRVLLGLLGREVIDNQVSGIEDEVRNVFRAFFTALYDGRYNAAAQLYGGSYETLQSMNPAIAPNDHAALWNNACNVNGFVCLRVRRIIGIEKVAPERLEFRLTVEFAKRDGSPWVRQADGQSKFVFTVIRSEERWRVRDLPMYQP